MAKLKVAFGKNKVIKAGKGFDSLEDLKAQFIKGLKEAGFPVTSVDARCGDGMVVEAVVNDNDIPVASLEEFISYAKKNLIDSEGYSVENMTIFNKDGKLTLVYWTADTGDCL